MFGTTHTIYEHKEIVPKCEGCKRINKRLDGIYICGCHSFPHTKWWFDGVCPQATHIKHQSNENPYKEPWH